MTALVVGSGHASSAFLNGKIAEVVVYNRVLTTADRLQSYFAARYNISLSTFAPTDVAGLVLDMNADTGVSTTGGLVDSWANQGSIGGTFAASGGGRPTLTAGAVHGGNAVVFDGLAN
jgi:shikimate 5-dehydrogenase